jgi:predicted outer membrane protein
MALNRFLVCALALALAPACTDDDDDDVIIVEDPVGDAVAEGTARGEALADQAFDELTGNDYAIVIGKTATILATLNDGEIAQAQFAIQVVNADDVFDLANEILIDHEDANAELDSVVRFYGVPYLESSTADALAADASAALAELRATPPQDIDFVYTDLQVVQHAQALVVLDELYVQVGAGEMGDFILNSRDMVAAHLEDAEDILETFF